MGLLLVLLYPLLRVVDWFLLRRLPRLPEVERKLLAGEYGALDAARAEYFLEYCVRRGLYIRSNRITVEVKD